MKFLRLLTLLTTLATMPPLAAVEAQPLWSGKAPQGNGEYAEEPKEAAGRMTIYRPKKPNGTAVVICPGGGYGGLVTGGEGKGIAEWLNGHGITGVVLEYRLPKGRPWVPILDAQQAIRSVRQQAGSIGCKPDRIGIIGFSAGGHLASTAATFAEVPVPEAAKVSCRPDFAILIYPVISLGSLGHRGSTNNLLGKEPSPELITKFSTDEQVSEKTCPTYLAHAVDDKVVAATHSEKFHAALKAKNIATAYLPLASGGHGLNGYKGPMWDAWQAGALKWLAERGFVANP